MGQALGGGVADATGAGALWTGFTGRDIATGRHLGADHVQQQQQLITQGTIQAAGTLPLMYGAAKAFTAAPVVGEPVVAEPAIELPVGGGVAEPLTPPEPIINECPAGSDHCFTAETMLWTIYGPVLITELRQGRRVLSRSQHDPDGPLTERLIIATYENTAPIWEIGLGGKVIRTTAEHPFWARGKGRVETASLVVGDELAGKDGEWTVVERVMATDRVEKVYNITIEEDHTYFVGGNEWGFAVWAHNYGENGRPDLFRTGNAQGPSPIRVGTDIIPDPAGNVGPTSPPTGLSTFDSEAAVITKGRLWRLPGDVPLPEGIGATPDAPPPGHVSIGPTQQMSLSDFLDKLGQLPWVDTGIKIR